MADGVAVNLTGVVVLDSGVHVDTAPAACCCCPTECSSLPDYIGIDGYVDGDLSACDSCVVVDDYATWCLASQGKPCEVWDGTWERWTSDECQWVYRIHNANTVRVFDHALSPTTSQNLMSRVYCDNGTWWMEFYCQGDSSAILLWKGKKTSGEAFGPLGVYTKTSGCAAGPSTLSIVEAT